jgi:hypothetical protein
MIKRFNRQQIILGTLNLFAGAIILVIAWMFFRYTSRLLMSFFWNQPPVSPTVVAHAVTGILVLTGIMEWRRGEEGYRVFKDSAFYASLDHVSGGAFMTQRYLHRVTGPAYIISQLFLAGPHQICRGVTRLRSLLPNHGDLEKRMEEVLGWLKASGEWQTALKYRDNAEEIGALIRCGRVDFSITKLRLRAVT